MTKKIRRGRPSSIDLIPEDLRIRIVEALKDRRLTQKEILETFNQLLNDRQQPTISRSALNRYALFVVEKNAMLKDAREAATAIVGKLGHGDNDLGRALIEIAQTLAFHLTMEETLTIDQLSQIALLVQRLETAGKISLDRELKIKEMLMSEQQEKLKNALDTGLITQKAHQEAIEILGWG